MDPDSRRLRVSVTDGRGRAVQDGGLAGWLASVAPRLRGEVAVALASDARVRALNRTYRGKDVATDVLAFEATEPGVPAGGLFLGDVVIATGVARRQAREAGHPYQSELRVLALHGLLHLLGYDHDAAGDRGAMARVEGRLRRKGGLEAGLISRSATSRSRSRSRGRAGAPSRRRRAVTRRSTARR